MPQERPRPSQPPRPPRRLRRRAPLTASSPTSPPGRATSCWTRASPSTSGELRGPPRRGRVRGPARRRGRRHVLLGPVQRRHRRRRIGRHARRGAAMLVVGKDLTLESGPVQVGFGTDPGGAVVVGGKIVGKNHLETNGTGDASVSAEVTEGVGSAKALAPYAALGSSLGSISQDLARTPVNGRTQIEGNAVSFVGDGTRSTQVFSVSAAQATRSARSGTRASPRARRSSSTSRVTASTSRPTTRRSTRAGSTTSPRARASGRSRAASCGTSPRRRR